MFVGIRPNEPPARTILFVITHQETVNREMDADARVLMVAIDEAGVPTQQSLAVYTSKSPDLKEANLTPENPGRRRLRVNVNSEQPGEASFDVPSEVRPAPASRQFGSGPSTQPSIGSHTSSPSQYHSLLHKP